MKFNDKFEKVKKKAIKLKKTIRTVTKVGIVFFYTHVNTAMVRNFSSTTEPSNDIIGMSKVDNSSDSENLEKLTIKQLRGMAKKHNINLKSQRKKNDIINRIGLYFLSKSKSSDLKIVSTNLELRTDEKDRVDISPWFRDAKKKQGFNPLKRFLTNDRTRRLAKIICVMDKSEPNEVIHETEKGTFVSPEIAVEAASYLDDYILIDILRFYLVARPAEIEKQIQERTNLQLKELGIKFNKHIGWDKFNFPFAYYLIKIDNAVKAGIVGEKEKPRTESLDSRLSVHRSTYARFELINVFEFQNSDTVKLFEKVTKLALFKYNIGLDKNTKLEQYECPGKDSGQIINELVSQIFKNLDIENQHLGTECPKEKIDAYNKISLKLLGSTGIDDFGEGEKDI